MSSPPVALTIAGSDSGGGAGIQADLKTFAAFGVYGASAITAVTVQNTKGVTRVSAVPADVVTAQIEAVASDIAVHATKTGMLLTAAIVEAVAAAIQELQLPAVVVDPVMVAKGGRRLLDVDGVRMLSTELLPRAMVVTPNWPEAAVLAGHPVESLEDVRRAAQTIRQMGVSAVVVTGGHGSGEDIVDVVYDGSDFTLFKTPRVHSRSTHGTGCTFASAIAACLAVGQTLHEAVPRAQAYLEGAIRHAPAVGQGHGPVEHFWNGIQRF
jgi:hydroxymethylpyrimidine/phosphomethylpyrimidine kinase